MKILTSILLSFTLAFAGCGTLGKPDPGLVQFVAQDVGFLGAQAAMTYNPSFRAELELTRQALQGFVAAGSGNVTNLQAILGSHLPANFGNQTNGLITLGTGGIVLYNAAGAVVAKLDKGQYFSTYAQPIAQGLLSGISQALGKPTSEIECPRRSAYAYNQVLSQRPNGLGRTCRTILE